MGSSAKDSCKKHPQEKFTIDIETEFSLLNYNTDPIVIEDKIFEACGIPEEYHGHKISKFEQQLQNKLADLSKIDDEDELDYNKKFIKLWHQDVGRLDSSKQRLGKYKFLENIELQSVFGKVGHVEIDEFQSKLSDREQKLYDKVILVSNAIDNARNAELDRQHENSGKVGLLGADGGLEQPTQLLFFDPINSPDLMEIDFHNPSLESDSHFAVWENINFWKNKQPIVVIGADTAIMGKEFDLIANKSGNNICLVDPDSFENKFDRQFDYFTRMRFLNHAEDDVEFLNSLELTDSVSFTNEIFSIREKESKLSRKQRERLLKIEANILNIDLNKIKNHDGFGRRGRGHGFIGF